MCTSSTKSQNISISTIFFHILLCFFLQMPFLYEYIYIFYTHIFTTSLFLFFYISLYIFFISNGFYYFSITNGFYLYQFPTIFYHFLHGSFLCLLLKQDSTEEGQTQCPKGEGYATLKISPNPFSSHVELF